MEAKELRLGNWINYLGSGEVQIKDAKALFNSMEQFNYPHSKVTPIPLTEQWLIKFGFEYRTDTGFDGWYSNPILGESIRIFEVENKWYKYSSAHIVIKHVHQLQNLYFALTGEELGLQDT